MANFDRSKYTKDEIADGLDSALGMLRNMEWNGDGGTCPVCGEPYDHNYPICELQELLTGFNGKDE